MSTVGQAALSAFVTSLLTKLSSSEVLELATEKQACMKELKKWEEILQDIQPLLSDAEVKQWEDLRVKEWLADLQHLVYDMDDILDVFATKSLERKVMQKQQASTSKMQKFVSTSFIMPTAFKYFNTDMMSKMKKITHRLQDLENWRTMLALSVNWELPEISGGRLTTSFFSERNLHGRKKETDEIVELLLNNTVDYDRVSVICITGMGGIGKTTLAQLVFNDDRVQNYFDFRVWVCVSDDFDVTRITKSILGGISSEAYGATDLRVLQVKLKEKLSNRKFLFVLDDVWNENYADWQILQSPFGVGASGSKILVTTRSGRVSAIMGTIPAYQLEGLSDPDCLSIFTEIALGATNFSEYPHLEEIGKEIVKRFHGLPLAARAIGALLRTNLNQKAWEKILLKGDQIWDPSENSSQYVIPALRLSYDHLPSRLKQCFAYCSIFPKGYEFREEEIVWLWMAEGFLSEMTDKKEMEELGGEYFQKLVTMSFFQKSSIDKSRFLMHDLINDLAQSVAGTICFRMEGDRLMTMSKNIRHLSYDSALNDEFKNSISSKNLRTFIPFILPPPHNTYRSIPNNILLNLLPKLKFLRVLSLREFSMSQLPDSIGDLRHLRYLDVSHAKIKSLPDTVCALHNLQTLLLRQCMHLEKLPWKIGNLINLCHLDIAETFSLRGMPIQIGELTQLQTLSSFVLAPGDGCHIRAMNLMNLKGELSISGLENIFTAEDALEAGLRDKWGLKRLKLKWTENFDRNLSKGIETKVLDMLQPPKKLEELTIEGYDGTLFPNWVGDLSFRSLLYLEFKNCKTFTSMPSIGELPLLRELCVRGCNSMKSVGVEFYGKNLSNVFLSLETLCFEDMLEWKEWNPSEVDELEGSFRRLRELSIISCPKLLGSLPSNLPSLKKLVIRGCKELKVSVSTFPVLHDLEIDGCKNLVHISPVKSSLLKEVSVSNILQLTCLTDRLMLGFRNVKSLEIDGCEELISLWLNRKNLLAHMGSLDILKISNCPKLVLEAGKDEEELQQVEIPCIVDHLNLSLMSSERANKLPKASHVFTSLKELRIERCPKLISFSEAWFPLTLKRLVISYCENLQYLLLDKGKDININNSSLLEYLEIEWCPSLVSLTSSCESSVRLQHQQIDSPSSSAKLLAGIKKLRISYCPKLLSISGELPVRLQHLQVWCCTELTDLSKSGKLPEELKRLQISNCPRLTSIAKKIHDNSSLEYIGVICCSNIHSLPQGLDELRHLQEIELVYCRLISFPESWFPTTNLKMLHIDACENLQTLPNNFHNLTSLERLEISNCCFPEEGFPIQLKSLSVSQPKTQKTLKEWELHKLTSLEQLLIEGGCPNVVSFPPEELEMILPTSLVELTVKDFPSLQFLSSKHFEKLKSIRYLSIMDCPKVMSLPKKDTLLSLSRLHIDDCPLLKTRCFMGRLEWHKIAHIPYVRIDDKLLGEED
ncbi:hypothetical protein CRYUN_Cryun01aG0008000 [Craigia yunnanensis]